MIPLLLLSLLSIYIFVERLQVIRRAAREDNSFMERIKDYIHEGNIDSALKLCKKTNTPYARLIAKGISRLGRPMNDVLVAIGGRGLGTSHAKAYSQIYVSQDNGLTWSEDGRFYLPAGFNGTGEAAAMAVDNKGFIWIICGGTGEVWRGRLNRMGWADQKTSFTE